MKQSRRPLLKLTFGIALGLIVGACNNSGNSAPGAVSEGEARALDEAAEMLEERNLPEGALPPIEAPSDAQQTGPENQEAE